MQRLIIPVFLVLGSVLSYGQESNDPQQKFMFVELRGHSGTHFYTGEALSATLDNGYGALEVRLGWQTSGDKDWHGAYGYPSYGVGWYTGAIGNPDILGAPNALYGFINFPLQINKRNTLVSDLALGYTYDLNPYDPDGNPNNDAIGARGAVYFNLGIGFRYELNREIDLTYGLDFTHFSNGRSFQPNYGLNMMGVFLGTRYNFNNRQSKVDPSVRPTQILNVRPNYPDEWSDLSDTDEDNILLFGAIGTSQNSEDAGTSNRYFNSSVVLEYQHFFNLKHGATVGLDYFYDGSVEFYGDEPNMFGYHVGYDYRIWIFSIRLQAGGYFSAPDRKGGFFFRPAGKFDITDHLYAQVGLKTLNGGAADWVEFGIGVDFM